MEHLFRYIAENWVVLSRAPLVGAVLIVLGASLGLWAARFRYKAQLDALRERVSLAEDRNRDAGISVPALISGGDVSRLHRGVLHPDAERRLTRELALHKGNSITMRALGNMRAQRCLSEFRRVFEAAGWSVTNAPWDIIGEATGVWLSPKNRDNPCAAAQAASGALHASGFEIAMGQNGSLPDDTLELIIGNPEPL
jgi:hypothetical protein